MNLSHQNNKI